MNGLNLMTVIPGRNKVPGIYSSNFSPVDHSTMPMLTRLAIGAIVIQTADHDQSSCTEDCTLALWIKTCPADCDDSTWAPIPLGAPVPDRYCVSGTLTPANVLVLTLSNGDTLSVDLSALAVDNDHYPVAMSLAGNILTMTMNAGAPITVDLSALVATASPPLPVAQIERLSKIGLVASFTGASSNATRLDALPLTYQWSTVPAASISTPLAQNTNIVFPSPGQYTVTLTVTDAFGAIHSQSEIVKVDRVLEINGADIEINDLFTSLSAALTWINTNDPPSPTSRWLVRLFGQVDEPAAISLPSYTILQIMPNGLLNFTFNANSGALGLGNATESYLIGDGSERVQVEALGQFGGGAYAVGFGNSTNCGMSDITVGGVRGIGVFPCPTPVYIRNCVTKPHGDVGIAFASGAAMPNGLRHQITDCDFYAGDDTSGNAAAINFTYTGSNHTVQAQFKNCRAHGYGWNDGAGTAQQSAITFNGAGLVNTTADIVFDGLVAQSNGLAPVWQYTGDSPLTRTGMIVRNSSFDQRGTAVNSFASPILPWTAARIFNSVVRGGFGATVTPLAGADNVTW